LATASLSKRAQSIYDSPQPIDNHPMVRYLDVAETRLLKYPSKKSHTNAIESPFDLPVSINKAHHIIQRTKSIVLRPKSDIAFLLQYPSGLVDPLLDISQMMENPKTIYQIKGVIFKRHQFHIRYHPQAPGYHGRANIIKRNINPDRVAKKVILSSWSATAIEAETGLVNRD
jgi:hypothetical protein